MKIKRYQKTKFKGKKEEEKNWLDYSPSHLGKSLLTKENQNKMLNKKIKIKL